MTVVNIKLRANTHTHTHTHMGTRAHATEIDAVSDQVFAGSGGSGGGDERSRPAVDATIVRLLCVRTVSLSGHILDRSYYISTKPTSPPRHRYSTRCRPPPTTNLLRPTHTAYTVTAALAVFTALRTMSVPRPLLPANTAISAPPFWTENRRHVTADQ